MARSSSKRTRKERDKFALKHKGRHVQHSVDVVTLLSDELRNECLEQQVTVQKKKLKTGGSTTKTLDDTPSVRSKSEQRRLKQLERQKQAQAKVNDAVATLNSSKLDNASLGILLKTSMRGGTLTARQRLHREKMLHQAGVQVPANSDVTLRTLSESLSCSERHQSSEYLSETSQESDDSNSSDGILLAQVPAAMKATDGVKTHFQKRDLSQRAPPTMVAFGRKAHDAVDRGTKSELQSEREGSQKRVATSVQPLIDASKMVAEDLRHQMIASGEIHVEDAADPAPGQPRSVPSLGPTRNRVIMRAPAIDEARLQLPVLGMEQEIMATVDEHDILLLCGATGCGKTTQVPQFLIEAGFGSSQFPDRCGVVGVTQPRRVAAISTARRVAEEVGQAKLPSSDSSALVGYQVRHDKAIGSNAILKFMTDGILMREVQEDFLLTRYSVIIIDEAHERSINTDLLIGMLSRIVPQRRAMHQAGAVHSAPSNSREQPEARLVQPLKLIIMSATLRIDDFLKNERLFPRHLYPVGPPPLISVPARQFPVTVHFSRKTELEDYIGAAYRKVSRIHRELPPGGILVFVTGQREVQQLCKRLQAAFSKCSPSALVLENDLAPAPAASETADQETTIFEVDGADRAEAEVDVTEGHRHGAVDRDLMMLGQIDDFDLTDTEEDEDGTLQLGSSRMSPEDITAAEELFECKFGLNSTTIADAGSDEEQQHDAIGARAPCMGGGCRHAPAHVLPLYAMLLPQEQRKVFEKAPGGHRLIVVATNVAETSLTIPGVRYVVDTGRAKAKIFDESSGVNRYEVRWISQASADQRAGRAGRTGPGHCYRLFSSAVFNDTFPTFSAPEIQNMPLEGVVLSMHAMGLPKIINFPFPSPPSVDALRTAEQCLLSISALQLKRSTTAFKSATGSDLELTTLGKAMAAFPLSPRHSRMILAAVELVSEGANQSVAIVHHALGLAAALSSESPFLEADTVATAGMAHTGNSSSDEERATRIRNRVYSTHQRLRDSESDAISALNALLAFEAEPEDQADLFCKSNFLHATHLREMSALRAQLVKIVQMPSCGRHLRAGYKAVIEDTVKLPEGQRGLLRPPSKAARKALSRCIASGWADQIAKRVRSTGQMDALAARGKTCRAVRYLSCSHDADLFLHPKSFLHKLAPEYVVYVGQTRTNKRTYMHTLTCVDPEWLVKTGHAMCSISEPAPEVSPAYDQATDRVLAWCHVSYGLHSWPLPMHAVTHPDPAERCTHFASALLSGNVVQELRDLQQLLNVKAAHVATTKGRTLRRVLEFIAVLKGSNIDNLEKLLSRWQADGNFLKPQLIALMQKGTAPVLEAMWPRLMQRQLFRGCSSLSEFKT